jgi:hypothetical protein
MWFCGAMYMEIVVNRFLGKSDVVTKYENWLKTVCDKNNVTRAEVEAYYRNGIRSLIAEVVDEEFNKISFLLDKTAQVSYNAILTCNTQTGQYILSYGGVETNGEIRTVTGNSVDELSHEMRNGKGKSDFTQLSVDQVLAQAKLVPAVVYADLKQQGYAAAPALVTEVLTNFYINPTQDNYRVLLGIEARYVRAFSSETFS